MKNCPNCNRRLTRAQETRGGIFCSRICAGSAIRAKDPGKNVRISPRDAWEKVAPKMTRRQSVKDWEASRLFFEDKQRHRRAE
jgi:hypothetical protein